MHQPRGWSYCPLATNSMPALYIFVFFVTRNIQKWHAALKKIGNKSEGLVCQAFFFSVMCHDDIVDHLLTLTLLVANLANTKWC